MLVTIFCLALIISCLLTKKIYLAGLTLAALFGALVVYATNPSPPTAWQLTPSPETTTLTYQLEEISKLKQELRSSSELANGDRVVIEQLSGQIAALEKKLASRKNSASESGKKTLSPLQRLARRLKDQQPQPLAYRNTLFNYKIDLSSYPVELTSPLTMEEGRQFILTHRKSKHASAMVAETVNPLSIQNPLQFDTSCIMSLRTRVGDVVEIDKSHYSVNNYKFITSRLDVKIGKHNLHYFVSTLFINGYGYQFLSWSLAPKSDTEALWLKLREDHYKILHAFKLIDPQKEAPGYSLAKLPQEYTDSASGLRVAENKLPFRRDSMSQKIYPESLAAYAHPHASSSTAHIYAFHLNDLPTDKRILEETFTRYEGIEITSQRVEKPLSINGHTIQRYQYYFADSTPSHYIIEIAHNGSQVCCIISKADDEKSLLETLTIWEQISWGKPALTLPENSENSQADFLNKLGLSYYMQEDYFEASDLFKRAAEVNQSDSATYISNQAQSLSHLGKYAAALNAIQRVLTKHPDNLYYLVKKADYLYSLDRADESFDLYETVFKKGHDDDEYLLDFLNRLIDQKQTARGVNVMLNVVKQRPSSKMKRWLASLLIENEQYTEAEATLSEVLVESPKDVSAIDLLIDVQLALNNFTKAHTLVDRLESIDPSDANNLLTKASIYTKQRKHKESYDILKELSTKYPNNSVVQEKFSIASASLGLGDHRDLDKVIAAVPIPDSLQQLNKKYSQLANTEESEHSVTFLSSIVALNLSNSGRFTETKYYTVRVNTAQGVERFKNWAFSYYPTAEDFHVNSLTIRSAEGEITHTGKTNEYFITNKESSSANHHKTLNIPNYSLTVGSTIELVITRRYWSTNPVSFPFEEYWIDSSYPKRFSALSVGGKIDQISHHLSRSLNTRHSDKHLVWWKAASAPYIYESFSPDSHSLMAKISLGSKLTSWKEVSANYHEYIAHRFDASAELKQEIEAIVGPHIGREAKVNAIIQWMQTHCSYRAIAFGPRGRMPKSAIQTLRKKEGDCKDMSLLLWHALKHIGIESHLALANTDDLITPEVASEDQFNHLVVYCPSLKQNPVIDLTHRHLNVLATAPQSLATYQILPIAHLGADLITVAPTEHSRFDLAISRQVTKAKEHLLIDEKITLTGYAAAGWRSALIGSSKSEQRSTLHGWINETYPNMTLNSVNCLSGLDNALRPLVLEVSYSYPLDDELTHLPTPWEQVYFNFSQANKRRNPIERKVETRIKSSTHYSGEWLSIAPCARTLQKSTVRQFSQQQSTIICTSIAKPYSGPASEFDNFRKELQLLVPKIKIR